MKKTVTLYQAATSEAFRKNMMALSSNNYADIDEMEAVAMIHMEGDDRDILDRCFIMFNQDKRGYVLNYSMSVGDIVTVDNAMYRCLPFGWKRLGN